MGEDVVIGTFLYDFKGFLGSRNFWMETKAGEMLATANSLWTLLDFSTMKPVAPTAEHLAKYTVEPKIDMEYAGRKVAIPELGEVLTPIKVTRECIDTNHHMNNAKYLDWIADLLPSSFHKDHTIADVTLCYINEAREADGLDVTYGFDPEGCMLVDIHRPTEGADHDRIFAAKISYQEI